MKDLGSTEVLPARIRAGALVAGMVMALTAMWLLQHTHVTKDEADALGQTGAAEAVWQGVRLSAWAEPEIYGQLFTATNGHPHAKVGCWLGNSQLHTINDYHAGDQSALRYASEQLGWPMLGLLLPNASLQEHYVVAQWLFTQVKPAWLVVPVCFDDLREDGLREGMKVLGTPETLAAMRRRPAGMKLADELGKIGVERGDAQGTTRKPRSWQQQVEELLERELSARCSLWARRGTAQARCSYALYDFRNWVFRITPSSKRNIIPVRRTKNMDALKETLELAREHQVRCLVYIVPLRWDVEPPYHLSQYADWKQEVQVLCAAQGARFADLDRLVPNECWGLLDGKDIDFMHFKHEGQVLLGRKVAGLLQDPP